MNQLSTMFLLCCGTLFPILLYGQKTIAYNANKNRTIETLQEAQRDYSNVFHLKTSKKMGKKRKKRTMTKHSLWSHLGQKG